jgi:4-hydroxy-3-methylbut-2-enyl diphosphate reductase
MDTSGKQIIDWNDLSEEDVVIVPAFGTTVEIQDKINEIGINTLEYDTTCPFVEKVWNKATVLGKAGYTIIVHGKHNHEETRATFSHSKEHAPTLIVRNIEETSYLCDIIMEEKPYSDFYKYFEGKYSEGFDLEKHLNKIGVVNQTTMLATETQEIADWLKCALMSRYGENKIREHFAETRDTLCYATHDNQKSTYALLEEDADLALVVGGYNSSNTSHIVELCEKKLKTYFISNEEKIISKDSISHFDIKTQKEIQTGNYLPDKKPLKIILTSGASCPDVIVESVMQKILSFYENVKTIEEVI